MPLQNSHFGWSKGFSTAISVQKNLQIAIQHLQIMADHLAISGGFLRAPLNRLKHMFRGGRQVFRVGQAPSGPTVIRPLPVLWMMCACRISGGGQLVDKRQLHGAQPAVDVDVEASPETDQLLALGGRGRCAAGRRNARLTCTHALSAARQISAVPLGRSRLRRSA